MPWHWQGERNAFGWVDFQLDTGITTDQAKGYHIQRAEELLPTLQQALADDTLSIIACPVDYSENIRLTDKLGKLTEPI